MSSSDRGTYTTTRPLQPLPHASVTAGTARSASRAYGLSAAALSPVPRTRLWVPRTTVTAPWSHSCCPAPRAGRSAATAHPPPAVRSNRSVREAVTGAVS
ncbi:hypothetical protein GCM10020256_57080 [Streptomyces thermocoprophilus]